jgi:hypothetical protein
VAFGAQYLDWPLSKDEKRKCVLNLYEKDVRTANNLLEAKDESIKTLHKEITVLRRRVSLGSASTRSSLKGNTKDDSSLSPPHPHVADKCSKPDDLEADRSNVVDVSDEVASMGEEATVLRARATNYQHDFRRERSPAAGGNRRRSSSLEATPSWWAPASMWQAVRKGAQKATETASGMSRILADEARLISDEVRILATEALPRRSVANAGLAVNGPMGKDLLPTDYIQWRIEIPQNSGGVGVSLEDSGSPHTGPRVSSIAQGLAIDSWNSSGLPVTVHLHPGNREAVIRRVVVRIGDELVAIDDEALTLCEGEATLVPQRLEECQTLSFRRRMQPRRDDASTTEDTNRCAAPGGA